MQMTDHARFPAQAQHSSGYRYQSVDAVVNDAMLDVQQKRAILSSWASDLFAVESCPWLREIPGIERPLRISDIFAALRELDDGPPPRGGASVRVLPAKRRTTDARMRPRPRMAMLKHA
jgi:hypothetical protein